MEGRSQDGETPRWLMPVVYILAFTIFFSSGLVWGGLTKSGPRPPLLRVPVYPNAQALADGSGKPVGLSSATPNTSGGVQPSGLTNFSFQTPDSPQAVLTYYRNALGKSFYFYPESTQTPQSMNGNFERQSDARTVEVLRLTASLDESGQTKVTVNYQVISQVP